MVAVPLHLVLALAELVSLVRPLGPSTTADADSSIVPVERRLLPPL